MRRPQNLKKNFPPSFFLKSLSSVNTTWEIFFQLFVASWQYLNFISNFLSSMKIFVPFMFLEHSWIWESIKYFKLSRAWKWVSNNNFQMKAIFVCVYSRIIKYQGLVRHAFFSVPLFLHNLQTAFIKRKYIHIYLGIYRYHITSYNF